MISAQQLAVGVRFSSLSSQQKQTKYKSDLLLRSLDSVKSAKKASADNQYLQAIQGSPLGYSNRI